jgi:Predicted transcriptional regulator
VAEGAKALGQSEKSYRSKLRIYFDILKAIELDGAAKPTHIMYKANLSYERLSKYLEELLASGLIQVLQNDEAKLYTLSTKGKKFVKEVEKAIRFVSAFGIEI